MSNRVCIAHVPAAPLLTKIDAY
ncbi:hypothetical protein RHECNPAF_17000126 [Rhizobium etli CNPAF512]|nr:hypothetical protein RHECNPAF_17000126 [Rhizobium etli CNPAF512]